MIDAAARWLYTFWKRMEIDAHDGISGVHQWERHMGVIDALRSSLETKLTAEPHGMVMVRLACESMALRQEPTSVADGTNKLIAMIARYKVLDDSEDFPDNFARFMVAMRAGHIGNAEEWRSSPPSEDAIHGLLAWMSVAECSAMNGEDFIVFARACLSSSE